MSWWRFGRRVQSAEDFERRRLARFRQFVAFVQDSSPWYERVIAERGIDTGTCRPEDFPVLTKEDVAAHLGEVPEAPQPEGVLVAEVTPDAVRKLNELQPAAIRGRASALAILAAKQMDGDLWIRPASITSTGEPLARVQRRLIEGAFGECLRDVYWSREHGCMGVREAGCSEMGFNETDLIPERHEDHTLVTNLKNREVPLIRYRMNDVPQAGYVGRAEDSPRFLNRFGEEARLTCAAVLEVDVPQIRQYQIQVMNRTQFDLLVVPDPGASRRAAFEALRVHFGEALRAREMGNVCFDVIETDEIPVDPKSGKFQFVV